MIMTNNENNVIISGHLKYEPSLIYPENDSKILATSVEFSFIEEALTGGYIERKSEQSVYFLGKLIELLIDNDKINEGSWVRIKGCLDNGNVVAQEVTYINNNNKAVTLINEYN